MFTLFKKRKPAVFYFQGYPPKERIDNFILQFLKPTFDKNGFDFKQSDFSFRKKSGCFTQVICFRRSQYNTKDDIVRFEIMFSICDSEYSQWHSSFYGLKPESSYLHTINTDQVTDWDKEFMNGPWYDLAAIDNDLLNDRINNNLETVGLPALDKLSNRQTAIVALRRTSFYVCSFLFDYCVMLNDKDSAGLILEDFEFFLDGEHGYQYAALRKNYEMRKEAYKNWK